MENAIETSKIERFENIIEIGQTLRYNWYRGHSKEFGNLLPGVFRPNYHSYIFENLRTIKVRESDLIKNFQLLAPITAETNMPAREDYISWLFWMQHYGLPTRLLDWSGNIFVAAFFACVDHSQDDGELYTLYPESLNAKFVGDDSTLLQGHEYIRYLAAESFYESKSQLQTKFEISTIPNQPLALNPAPIFKKMNAQASRFTIHPNQTEGGKQIEEVITQAKEIMRYIIPARLKPGIIQTLNSMGINYRTIFPDLNGLSKWILEENKILGWGQPDPPKYNN